MVRTLLFIWFICILAVRNRFPSQQDAISNSPVVPRSSTNTYQASYLVDETSDEPLTSTASDKTEKEAVGESATCSNSVRLLKSRLGHFPTTGLISCNRFMSPRQSPWTLRRAYLPDSMAVIPHIRSSNAFLKLLRFSPLRLPLK